jgi:hypothetical protein
MKSFKTYITEAVPNRSHGRVFRQFFDMGKRREEPFDYSHVYDRARERDPRGSGEISVAQVFGILPKNPNQMDIPAHVMNFPSFKDDSLGRRQSLRIRTIPGQYQSPILSGYAGGVHVNQFSRPSTSTNFIDLSRIGSISDQISTIGHEAFHSVQTARARYPWDRARRGDLSAFGGPREYIDAIGNPRKTNDISYADEMNSNPHIKNLKLSDSRSKYEAKDIEHDARLGGAIARFGYDAGRQHAMYGFLGQDASQIGSYEKFHKLVKPYTDRQAKRTRDAYGRIAQEYQNITGAKVNR